MNSSEHWKPFALAVSKALANTECNVPFSLENRPEGPAIYIAGNGGSAGIASHIATDLMKFCKRPVITLTDAAILTCFANDYGYENAFSRMMERYCESESLFIAISSSGMSPNICRAAETAAYNGAYVLTLSGFDPGNTLRQIGHSNYYVPSNNYGVVECAHLILLHSIVNPGVL